MPWSYLLEATEGIEPWLLNAQHIKTVPGRKTDVKDCEWVCRLVEYGLVRPSFVPPRDIRQLRDLARYRTETTRDRVRDATGSRCSWKTPRSSSARSSATSPAAPPAPCSDHPLLLAACLRLPPRRTALHRSAAAAGRPVRRG
ncbi:transposase [Streptomyces sp. GD-15H]|uniref:IS110 family transposase n=1 Tax=Streptomyces sp. GD-15H TaxID=3129112 RepID=UPI003251F61E